MTKLWKRKWVANPFKLLAPAQHILAKARRAGVDTRKLEDVERWRKGGGDA